MKTLTSTPVVTAGAIRASIQARKIIAETAVLIPQGQGAVFDPHNFPHQAISEAITRETGIAEAVTVLNRAKTAILALMQATEARTPHADRVCVHASLVVQEIANAVQYARGNF